MLYLISLKFYLSNESGSLKYRLQKWVYQMPFTVTLHRPSAKPLDIVVNMTHDLCKMDALTY